MTIFHVCIEHRPVMLTEVHIEAATEDEARNYAYEHACDWEYEPNFGDTTDGYKVVQCDPIPASDHAIKVGPETGLPTEQQRKSWGFR